MIENSVNVELLRKELEFCEANPERHNQSRWVETNDLLGYSVLAAEVDRCGTAACLAGWTVLHAGLDVLIYGDGEAYVSSGRNAGRHVRLAATKLLGLSQEEAMLLFMPFNTITQLWYLAHYLTDGAIDVPPQHDNVVARDAARCQVRRVRDVAARRVRRVAYLASGVAS